MSYYGRRWYSRRKWYSRNATMAQSVEPSPYWKSLEFVRNEFFNLDPFTFVRFVDFYGQKYGEGAKRYLKRTYPGWKNGATKTSGQTERRILACVLPFLDKGKQFELLSFQIPAVVRQQKAELKVPVLRTSVLETTYHELSTNIVQRQYKLDWFVNEVFGEAEVEDFLSVFKYTMLDCLRLSYEQVRQDLKVMKDLLPKLDGGANLSYQIALLNCPLEIDVDPPQGAAYLHVVMPEPRLVTQFGDRYRAILLDHALAQCRAETVGHANSQVAFADVLSIVSQLRRTASDQEYDTTLEVQGHGGTLRIRLQKKNVLRLRYAIAQQTLKLVFVAAVSVVLVVWICKKGFLPLLFYLGIIPLGIIGSMWEKLTELRTELTEYERQRTARFAATRY